MADNPAPPLPTNAYALLGLLTYGDALTGYELKQRADRTLRFYWSAPAMSQVYSELARLTEHGLVEPVGEDEGRGRRYALTDRGEQALQHWLSGTSAGFPVWKHPVALRLMVGHLTDDAALLAMLREYDAEVAAARTDLAAVLGVLEGAGGIGGRFRNPALVASWGLSHFDHEREVVGSIIEQIEARSVG